MSRNNTHRDRNRVESEGDRLRQRLYEVMDGDRTVADKQRRALDIGRRYLDVENGHVERVEAEGETHEVAASVGGDFLPEGTTLDRTTTYCRRTLESNSAVALSDAPAQGWADDPAYREHGFDCYLGTTIYVGGEQYGTVCFVSRASRETEFGADEKAFVELVARLLGRELEAVRHDRERDRLERDVAQSEEKYAALLETAPDAIFLVDAETGEIRETNAAAADLTGNSQPELVGTDVLEIHPPDDREQYRAILERTSDENENENENETVSRFPDGGQLYVRHADGTDIPVEMSLSTVELDGNVHVQGIVRDIADRRERERDLRLKNRAIEEAAVGVTIADATEADVPLVYANREFECMTGYDRTAVLGKNCRFLQGEATDEASIEEIREAIRKREAITTELLNYRADGTPFWNELTLTPVTDEAGATTHFVGFQRDVTARKRRERMVGVLNRVLRHNLRNEMTVVSNYADVLSESDSEDVAELATRILRSARDLTKLSEKAQTLETVMRNSDSLQPRGVGAAIREVVDTLRAAHPDASVEIEGEMDQQVIATNWLTSALEEVGHNAVEHGDDSPTVTYHVDSRHDETVRVHVSDDGPGLDPLERRVLQTGDESPLKHGQGLGLWLVNWIVTSAGGRVSTRVDEEGTTLTLCLPRAPADGAVGDGDFRQAAISMAPE